MNLAITALEFATVIDVRRTDSEHSGAEVNRGHTVELHSAVLQRSVLLGGRDGFAHGEQAVSRIVQQGHFARGEHPEANTIAVSRGLATLRMRTTGLAAIFNVHAE